MTTGGLIPHTQLNIVVCVDANRLFRTGDPATSVGLMDNCPASEGKGGPALRTACRRGQVLNWILYPVDGEQRDDLSWPVYPRLAIVMPPGDGRGPCLESGLYGQPDEQRDPLTPVYAYWAGLVRPDAAAGVHPYRIVLSCDSSDRSETRRFELIGPSLDVADDR
jgi:hypothetical protein